MAGDQHPAIGAFYQDVEIAQVQGLGFAFARQVDMNDAGDQRRVVVNPNIPGFAIRRMDLELSGCIAGEILRFGQGRAGRGVVEGKK